MYILRSYAKIKGGEFAYHLSGDIIDDVMPLTENPGNYKDKPVSQLLIDGWSFVCGREEYKKGDQISEDIVNIVLDQKVEINKSKEFIKQSSNLVPNFEKYYPEKECIKCGNKDMNVKFMEFNGRERVWVTCKKCGYRDQMLPMDAK